jgi:hypothetical protein
LAFFGSFDVPIIYTNKKKSHGMPTSEAKVGVEIVGAMK